MHVTVAHLSKSYAAVRALDDFSLELSPGQVVALVGANGAGKTTLLRCLAGVAGPDRGEVRYDGELFRRDRVDLRRRLAFLPDSPFTWPDRSVLDHIGLFLRVYERETAGMEEKAIELLRDFDLLPMGETPLNSLSRGQIYKAVLTAFLCVGPELWLLDEPFGSGMDPHGITSFKKHLGAAARAGHTVLYSTQLLEVAERFSDRVCILHQGRLHAFDRVDRLRAAAGVGGGLEEVFRQLKEAQP